MGLMRRLLVPAVLVAVVAVVPMVLPDPAIAVFVLLGQAAIVAAGVSLLMGYAGQVSLGQAGFTAIGAYTAGILAVKGLPPLLGLVAAPVLAAAFALLAGVPLLRLRGHYLAFATLALQLIVLSLAGEMEITGGSIGLRGIPQFSVGPVELDEEAGYAYLTWAVLGIVLLIARNVVASRPGRGLRALATSEPAARASGVPVGAYKLVVFALSAAFAGISGGLYAFYIGYVAPGSFPLLLSIEYVVMAVVGGLGTLSGALAGAVAITLLIQGLNAIGTMPGMPPEAPAVLSYAVYGALLVVVVLFVPRGLVPAARALAARIRLSRRARS